MDYYPHFPCVIHPPRKLLKRKYVAQTFNLQTYILSSGSFWQRKYSCLEDVFILTSFEIKGVLPFFHCDYQEKGIMTRIFSVMKPSNNPLYSCVMGKTRRKGENIPSSLTSLTYARKSKIDAPDWTRRVMKRLQTQRILLFRQSPLNSSSCLSGWIQRTSLLLV